MLLPLKILPILVIEHNFINFMMNIKGGHHILPYCKSMYEVEWKAPGNDCWGYEMVQVIYDRLSDGKNYSVIITVVFRLISSAVS